MIGTETGGDGVAQHDEVDRLAVPLLPDLVRARRDVPERVADPAPARSRPAASAPPSCRTPHRRRSHRNAPAPMPNRAKSLVRMRSFNQSRTNEAPHRDDSRPNGPRHPVARTHPDRRRQVHDEPMDTLEHRPLSSAQYSWLRRELADWQAAGIVDTPTADAIAARYRDAGDNHRRFSLGRILLFLGGAFVGVGLIWLVAANLDALPPLLRFLAVAAIWLALISAAELSRAAGAVRGSLRLMAALAFGAVIFRGRAVLAGACVRPRPRRLLGARDPRPRLRLPRTDVAGGRRRHRHRLVGLAAAVE
ncbi:DUF2157 domain-containing protein [Nocardioides sp. B-3]|uniref:DUF2157 domain-containing protein n=1 Tax=Nocardioides sp. B-3 TaxID=2895565 RepID=UPI0021523D00|nr:DUF2157 domain-containing protein [Nocardioides sp. B-3]UUZ57754.1 DUF2157 domain-containing protein [Nocardioides sp. B-3]